MSEIAKLQNEEDLNYEIMVAEKHLAALKDKLTKYKAKYDLPVEDIEEIKRKVGERLNKLYNISETTTEDYKTGADVKTAIVYNIPLATHNITIKLYQVFNQLRAVVVYHMIDIESEIFELFAFGEQHDPIIFNKEKGIDAFVDDIHNQMTNLRAEISRLANILFDDVKLMNF